MSVRLSSPDKLLWPEVGVTKAELAAYYEAVADRMLPHVADRPLSLKRYNAGVEGDGFFTKHLPDSAPAHLGRFRTYTPSSDREVAYLLADEVDDLVWVAQQNGLEVHAWFTRVDRPDRPDQLVFDIDPGPGTTTAVQAARWVREVLDELELTALVKTSGKRGLHLYVPIERRYDHGELRGFGLAVARACAARHPDELTVEMRKADRGDRLLLDWSRNGAAQTGVAAWSPRAHPAATVSMPLSWDEVTDGLDPTAFTVRSALDREDPWLADPCPPQRIERARDALAEAGFPSVDRSPRARTTPGTTGG